MSGAGELSDARDGAGAPSVLARILHSTRVELARRKRELPLPELMERVQQRDGERDGDSAGDAPRGFRAALSAPGIGVIAEFKRRSPSAGAMRDGADPAQIAAAYERGGACAVSILTEGPSFGGSLADLRAARAACALPVLRKDFVVDPYQLYEAAAASADAVLLIVAALGARELEELSEGARSLGLDTLTEVHDLDELQIALAAGAQTIGINNRDLRDFSVDVERTYELLAQIPREVPVVSESGIGAPEQLERLQQAGVSAVLVGESLMRAREPESALAALLGPVRAVQGAERGAG